MQGETGDRDCVSGSSCPELSERADGHGILNIGAHEVAADGNLAQFSSDDERGVRHVTFYGKRAERSREFAAQEIAGAWGAEAPDSKRADRCRIRIRVAREDLTEIAGNWSTPPSRNSVSSTCS